MYVVSELTRQDPISTYYASEYPFVVRFRFWYGAANEDIASFWSDTFGVTEPLTTETVITGVVYKDTTNYSAKDSLADCLLDDQSYYWDQDNQILYIHYNHDHRIDTNSLNFGYGISIGLTDDKLRYFENRPFMPFLVDFPQIEVSVDKFNYDQMSFIVDTITMDNRTGFFNQFKDTPIYGNKVLIKTGEEGDEYADLTERAVYFVDDYNFSATNFTLDIQDVRKTASAQVPNKILSVADYPNLGDTAIGKTIPFAYTPSAGFTRDVPGLLVNEAALDGTIKPDFVFLEVLVGAVDADIEVFVKDADDVWVEQTSGVTPNWSTGVITVNGAETLSGSTYSAFPVKANVRGVDNTYASDIIKDMNERFLGFNYDTSNYFTDEWEQEQEYLEPISLFMGATKDIYEWMREIQSLSSIGFRYTNTANNKRTIRVDNPNRDSVFAVQAVQVRNPEEVVAESNREDVYNKIYIGYNESVLNKTADRVENIDYFVESFATYKIESLYNKTSGLLTQVLAEQRALLQAEDYYAIHKVFEVELLGSQFLDLKIYDIIEVNISLQTKEITWTESGIVTATFGDEYFGLVRGQIISTRPNYALQTNTIRLREKAYSDLFESIYPSANSILSSGLLSTAVLGGD